ncbi:MAG: chromosome segregation SMC family protein, partial [Planctomycetota bacterium]
MKLKRLELYGFKSFADRTTFEFEDSLSALVGPNGSGKSNVVDAIKWVLGERSAQKLRGAEMTNVIFTGSESRKPLNFAEVQLVIDNADGWLAVDYEEVCIRRRVDRTGQSEYRLNGKQCRLKDIRNLLLDTGVGTSSYSFIEQGQIDRLLRSSPKERRLVFEEAAGINRFLEQKREAERKLERVGNNLARVNDIVEEVQRQLRSVKYQAGRARTFKKQTERLLRLRLAHGLHSLRALQANRDEHSRSIAAAQAERDRLAEQAAAVEAELEAARDALQNAQNELAESRQRLTRSDARLESLARESELNRRRSDELQQRLEAIGKRLTSLEERASALEEELAVASADLESSGEELQRRTNEFAARQQRAEEVRSRCRATQETIESKKAEVFDLFQQEAHVRNQAEVLAAEKRALQNRLNRVESRQSELAQQLDRAEAERGSTHQKLEEIQAQQADLDARVAQLQKALAEAQQRLTAVATQESETKADLRGQLGRRDVLRDLEARAEGVHSGVRQLLEADLPGTLGIVAGVLNVPLELAAAVEAALGDKVQAVIIERA